MLQGGSGLPEDRFINTFHFAGPAVGDVTAVGNECAGRVEQFYTATHGSNSLGQYISNYCDRTLTTTWYNIALPAGERIPTVRTGEIAAPLVDEGMPEEIAICLTIRGTPPWTPRRRGRVYLGPFVHSPSVCDWASTNAPARVESGVANNITSVILGAAAALATASNAHRWAIRSQVPTENFVDVDSGYVDDAFDTQRRRGPDPTMRTSFVHG